MSNSFNYIYFALSFQEVLMAVRHQVHNIVTNIALEV